MVKAQLDLDPARLIFIDEMSASTKILPRFLTAIIDP
jgi:hypothetical protein